MRTCSRYAVYLPQLNNLWVSSDLVQSRRFGSHITALCRALDLFLQKTRALRRYAVQRCMVHAVTEVGLLSGQWPSSIRQERGQRVMRGSMRSVAKWYSALRALRTWQGTDPWLGLTPPRPWWGRPGGPDLETGSGRDVFKVWSSRQMNRFTTFTHDSNFS